MLSPVMLREQFVLRFTDYSYVKNPQALFTPRSAGGRGGRVLYCVNMFDLSWQHSILAARTALPGHNSMALIFITTSSQPYPTPSSTTASLAEW